MAGILQDDEKSRRQFDERIQKAGHPAKPDFCHVDLLEWPPGNILSTRHVVHQYQGLRTGSAPAAITSYRDQCSSSVV